MQVVCELLIFITNVCYHYLFLLKCINLAMKIALDAGMAKKKKKSCKMSDAV